MWKTFLVLAFVSFGLIGCDDMTDRQAGEGCQPACMTTVDELDDETLTRVVCLDEEFDAAACATLPGPSCPGSAELVMCGDDGLPVCSDGTTPTCN